MTLYARTHHNPTHSSLFLSAISRKIGRIHWISLASVNKQRPDEIVGALTYYLHYKKSSETLHNGKSSKSSKGKRERWR